MVTCLLYVFVYFVCVCVCYGGLYLSCEYLVCSIRTTFLSFPFPTLFPPPPSKKENNALMFSLLIKDTRIPLEWWKHEPQFPSHICLWFRSRNLLEIRTLFWSELHVETVLGITCIQYCPLRFLLLFLSWHCSHENVTRIKQVESAVHGGTLTFILDSTVSMFWRRTVGSMPA